MNKEIQKEFLKWLVIKKPDMVIQAVFGKQEEPTYKTGDILEDGYIYVGIMSNDKERYHLAIKAEAKGKFTWDAAMDKFGEEMPTSQELSMVFVQGLFKDCDKFHWSSREHDNDFAYIQRFSNGYHSNYHKNNSFSVRCVRRFGYEKI